MFYLPTSHRPTQKNTVRHVLSVYQPQTNTEKHGKTSSICVGLWQMVRVGLWPGTRLLLGGAPGRVVRELLGTAGVSLGARGRERQLARHVLLAEERIAQDVVVHVAALGGE